MIDIKNIDVGVLLFSLWNNAKVVFPGGPPLTLQDAIQLASESPDGVFGVVKGRFLGVDLSGDTLDETEFDSKAGASSAQRAVDSARQYFDEMQSVTSGVRNKIVEAFDAWKEKYGMTQFQSAMLVADILIGGPEPIKKKLMVSAALTSAWAEQNGVLPNTPEHDAFIEKQLKDATVYTEALSLVMDLMPLIAKTGGALVLGGQPRK